jgi:adenylate cyclase
LSLSRRGIERSVRLSSGLVLFFYALTHFVNHAFGIRSLEAMQAAARYLLEPWQTLPGLVIVYTALLTHLALGLAALYRRRHLRIPAIEMMQLTLGLAVPLLLISHSAAVRLGDSLYDLQIGYVRVIYQYWIVSPDFALPRQILLLAVVWIHGCIGIRAWLSSKAWYPSAVPILASLATLVPVLALLGFINAGLDMRELVATNPAALPVHVQDAPGSEQAANFANVYRWVDNLTLGYVCLVAAVLALRAARDWHARRFRAIRITYPGGQLLTVPEGFSVLEASRWGGVPHASVCGGRGRCSTCRVDVVAGGEALPPPGEDEQRLLSRIGAPKSVRLACQIRPEHDIAVVPLVHSTAAPLPLGSGFGFPVGGRRETEVAALFVDLRQSTRLADDRLPYDTLFIVERYINAVSTAVRDCGGHVTNIAGDGIMSVFGVEDARQNGARAALKAALQLWDGIDALNEELGDELTEPLRFGIGLHVGVAVVGVKWEGGMEGMPFLGDTGNVAARLEAETKRMDCTMIVSKEALLTVSPETTPARDFPAVTLPGKKIAMKVACIRSSEELRQVLRQPAIA